MIVVAQANRRNLLGKLHRPVCPDPAAIEVGKNMIRIGDKLARKLDIHTTPNNLTAFEDNGLLTKVIGSTAVHSALALIDHICAIATP